LPRISSLQLLKVQNYCFDYNAWLTVYNSVSVKKRKVVWFVTL
jgi:hypothetical protein